MEPKLAAALQPILERAGEVAAGRFEALATNHLTAADDPSKPSDWTAPSAEEILPINCEAAGLPEAAVLETATQIAARMVAQATQLEPETTKALSAIADQANGKMAGLEFAVKTQASLERKILGDLAEAQRVGQTTSIQEVAASINDTLRYTMTFPSTDYARGTGDAIARLKADGYRQVKLKNYWGNADYQGINGVFEKDGYRFELQFHTPATFDLKTTLHAPYEAFRVSTDGPERLKLWDEMAVEQSKVPVPPGALGIGQQVTHTPPFLADVGVTPFRAADDTPIGFYDSQKFNQFLSDVQSTADSFGVDLDGFDRVTGVWRGETEPSVSLRVHDGEEAVRAYVANLARAYEQDGALLFGSRQAGDAMATFDRAVSQGEASAAMKKAGIDGGRFTEDGRLQIVGSGPNFVAQLDALAEALGSDYQTALGSFELLEKEAGDYERALEAYAKSKG